MNLKKLFESWPVYRQLTGADALGRGKAAQSKRSAELSPRTATADNVAHSICPYCAVGCAQKVYVKDGKVTQIEGNPDSPISRGRLCPKGSASKQLVTGPQRETEGALPRAVRAPSGRTSTSTPRWTWSPTGCSTPGARAGRTSTPTGNTLRRTMGIASLGGATLDNEENYLIKKLFTALGRDPDREPGPHLTQRHGSRSGSLLRSRRRDGLPARPGQLRLHRHHGLEHGRGPSGRVPVGDGGQGPRRPGDPHRPAVHPHQRARRPPRPAARRQ